MPGYKTVNGYLWPETDVDCCAVVFGMVSDLETAMRYCKNSDAAVQAGGNCGVWPRRMAQFFDKVYTFEPEADNFHCLASNLNDLPNVVCYKAALGYERQGIRIVYPEGLRNLGACAVDGEGDVAMLRIDDLSLELCDFIQLDVEGYEYEAIRGAMETINRHHPVLMVEDKGLSEKYGQPLGWSEDWASRNNYERVVRLNRDNVFVWRG